LANLLGQSALSEKKLLNFGTTPFCESLIHLFSEKIEPWKNNELIFSLNLKTREIKKHGSQKKISRKVLNLPVSNLN